MPLFTQTLSVMQKKPPTPHRIIISPSLNRPISKSPTHHHRTPLHTNPIYQNREETETYLERESENCGAMSGRSAEEKEKTKMRERQRRSITTNIFHGLRKHGGYRLSSRADINQVLRQLANEAGWIVEPDGTTYRSSSSSKAPDPCPLCGTVKIRAATTTPASSVIICSEGDCSTAASPHPQPPVPITDLGGSGSLYNRGASSGENPLGIYMYQRFAGGFIPAAGNVSEVTAGYQQLMYFQEARASNQNTPVASPRRL